MVQTAESIQKIGLLGGTFDPVHNGHLLLADHVYSTVELDAVWFIPAASPPHKKGHTDGQPITGFNHRLAMLQLATAQHDSFYVSDIESHRSAPSYSIDTINILLNQFGAQADLYFIIGADAFLEIDTWKQFRKLPEYVNFMIISRPSYSTEMVAETIRQNFKKYVYEPEHNVWRSPHTKKSFYFHQMDPVPISSTDIRNSIRNGDDITTLVPSPVKDYIEQQELYT